jgi:UDP-glucose 4-epimerase
MRTLLTGGGGFLGAWIIRRLLGSGTDVRVFDAGDNRQPAAALIGDLVHGLDWRVGDIADTAQVVAAAEGCDAVIHLAGVLTPFCRRDPLAGARINVFGTLNVFEAAKHHGIHQVIYTSSGGVFGLDDDVIPFPITHYGAFKLANEGSARAYWHDDGIASIGFRPFVVYGPGRESGLSAGPTLACRAAALGQPYVIPLTGAAALVYVDDVAAAYEAAVKSRLSGAHTINLPGTVATMEQVVGMIRKFVPDAALSCEGAPLPSIATALNEYSSDLLGLPSETTLEEGLRRTVEYYQSAHNLQG